MTTPTFEDQLRATLHRHAAATPVVPRPFDADEMPAPTAQVGRPRLRQRRPLIIAATVMAAAAAIGAFVVINARHPGEEQAPTPANPAVDPTPSLPIEPEPASTDTPAEALDRTRSAEAPKFLPSVLPDGMQIWSINSYDNSDGFAAPQTTQRWQNAAGGEITLSVSGVKGNWADSVETAAGWQVSWGDVDPSAPTNFGVSDRGSNSAFGVSKSVSRETILAFLDSATLRDPNDPLAGYDSSDPEWTLLDDHRGAPGQIPLGWSLDIRIGDTLDHATYSGGPNLMLVSEGVREPWARADSEVRQLSDGTNAYFTNGILEWAIAGRPFSLAGTADLATMLAVASSVRPVTDDEWNAALDDIAAGRPVDLASSISPAPGPAGLKYLPTKLPDGYAIWHLEHHPASHSYQDSAGREIIPKLFTGVAMGSSLDTSYDVPALQFWVEDALWPEPPSGAVIQFAADGSDQEYFVVDDGGLQVRWERDGNTLSLSGDLTADALVDIAASIQPVTDAEWATALDTLATKLVDGRSPLDEGIAGDVTITRYTDDIICGRWPDGLRRCQSLRAGSDPWSMVVERDGEFEAIGSWPTTEPLTTTAGVTIDQVQVGAVRFFRVVLPATGGLTINTGDDSGFSVNQEG